MKKTLFLLRHAKTKIIRPGQDDRDRTLKDRGLKDLKAVSAFLDRRGEKIDLVLCSPAVRTKQTLEGLHSSCLSSSEVTFEDKLYYATGPQLLAQIRTADDAASTLMVIGHNPGLHDLVLLLISRKCLKARPDLQAHFPTSALAIITFDVPNWSEISPGEGDLRGFALPN